MILIYNKINKYNQHLKFFIKLLQIFYLEQQWRWEENFRDILLQLAYINIPYPLLKIIQFIIHILLQIIYQIWCFKITFIEIFKYSQNFILLNVGYTLNLLVCMYMFKKGSWYIIMVNKLLITVIHKILWIITLNSMQMMMQLIFYYYIYLGIIFLNTLMIVYLILKI